MTDFNPRSHEGSDLKKLYLKCHRQNFNPRSHEGSDDDKRSCEKRIKISIHAPTRGATTNTVELKDNFQFQSTLPRGERRYNVYYKEFETEFQSTLPRGERPIYAKEDIYNVKFQSTLPRGERLRFSRITISSFIFQSTLPRGERR